VAAFAFAKAGSGTAGLVQFACTLTGQLLVKGDGAKTIFEMDRSCVEATKGIAVAAGGKTTFA
jgi:hypothetical protein